MPVLRGRSCSLALLAVALAACAGSEAPSAAPEAPAAPAAAPALVPTAAPMDASPGRRVRAPSGAWEAVVEEGGALSVGPADGARTPVDAEVDARLAFSPDEAWLVYARRGPLVETDLWRVAVPGGSPERLTDWAGSEDRPALSPDGRRLAFVSGRTGIASWWVISVDGPLPVPMSDGVQVTNVGVTRGRPGVVPEGFVPPPDTHDYRWTERGLEWVARGQAYVVAVPP